MTSSENRIINNSSFQRANSHMMRHFPNRPKNAPVICEKSQNVRLSQTSIEVLQLFSSNCYGIHTNHRTRVPSTLFTGYWKHHTSHHTCGSAVALGKRCKPPPWVSGRVAPQGTEEFVRGFSHL